MGEKAEETRNVVMSMAEALTFFKRSMLINRKYARTRIIESDMGKTTGSHQARLAQLIGKLIET